MFTSFQQCRKSLPIAVLLLSFDEDTSVLLSKETLIDVARYSPIAASKAPLCHAEYLSAVAPWQKRLEEHCRSFRLKTAWRLLASGDPSSAATESSLPPHLPSWFVRFAAAFCISHTHWIRVDVVQQNCCLLRRLVWECPSLLKMKFYEKKEYSPFHSEFLRALADRISSDDLEALEAMMKRSYYHSLLYFRPDRCGLYLYLLRSTCERHGHHAVSSIPRHAWQSSKAKVVVDALKDKTFDLWDFRFPELAAALQAGLVPSDPIFGRLAWLCGGIEGARAVQRTPYCAEVLQHLVEKYSWAPILEAVSDPGSEDFRIDVSKWPMALLFRTALFSHEGKGLPKNADVLEYAFGSVWWRDLEVVDVLKVIELVVSEKLTIVYLSTLWKQVSSVIRENDLVRSAVSALREEGENYEDELDVLKAYFANQKEF